MERKMPPRIPSNEEVIDELTKNLEDSCVKEENASTDEKYFNVHPDPAEKDEHYNDIMGDSEPEDAKNDSEENDEYFIDEVALKDRDIDLTDEQKQELKIQSEKLKNEGNDLFRNKDYVSATTAYTEGLRICPLIFEKERAILYANRAAAKAKFMTEKITAIEDCEKAIELDSSYVKAYLRRAHLYEEIDKLDEAVADYEKVLTFDPRHTESICTVARLKQQIQDRNEKLKEEMLGKLKDLGNIILKPFGLSTNNFQMQKDEATGGYSVQFNQNPT